MNIAKDNLAANERNNLLHELEFRRQERSRAIKQALFHLRKQVDEIEEIGPSTESILLADLIESEIKKRGIRYEDIEEIADKEYWHQTLNKLEAMKDHNLSSLSTDDLSQVDEINALSNAIDSLIEGLLEISLLEKKLLEYSKLNTNELKAELESENLVNQFDARNPKIASISISVGLLTVGGLILFTSESFESSPFIMLSFSISIFLVSKLILDNVCKKIADYLDKSDLQSLYAENYEKKLEKYVTDFFETAKTIGIHPEEKTYYEILEEAKKKLSRLISNFKIFEEQVDIIEI